MKAKDKIYNALVEKLGVKHPDVFKGFDVSTQATGWHYREFNRSDACFLGTSLGEALEAIQEWAWLREELY